jgi:hypothetical protein
MGLHGLLQEWLYLFTFYLSYTGKQNCVELRFILVLFYSVVNISSKKSQTKHVTIGYYRRMVVSYRIVLK